MKNKKIIGMLLPLLFITGCGGTSSTTTNRTVQELENESQKEVVKVNLGTSSTYSSLADMVADVKPSVVDVYSYGTNFTSAGSGVIIGQSDEGYYIITNHHVIDEAKTFEVVVYDAEDNSKTYTAYLIGGSPTNDIAVLKIETEDTLSVATFIDSSENVRVGTEVVAIGNPLGILGGTVTHGIISSIAREVYIEEIGYMSLLQTDAAINSGNSGGALFNTDGLLIGIVNSGYSSYEGLNFAIPAADALKSMTSLITTYKDQGDNYGYVVGESNIGLTLDESQVYSDSSLSTAVSVYYAASVDSGSDAYTAGIQDYARFSNGRFDTFYSIESINGTELESLEEGQKLLQQVVAGEEVTITYKEINYKRAGGGFFGGTSYFYLGDETKTMTFTASQYIYSL